MINNRFLGKGGIVDYQTSNTAYDKLAFIADNYPDMVKMYDTIMAHLKLPSGGGESLLQEKEVSFIPWYVAINKDFFDNDTTTIKYGHSYDPSDTGLTPKAMFSNDPIEIAKKLYCSGIPSKYIGTQDYATTTYGYNSETDSYGNMTTTETYYIFAIYRAYARNTSASAYLYTNYFDLRNDDGGITSQEEYIELYCTTNSSSDGNSESYPNMTFFDLDFTTDKSSICVKVNTVGRARKYESTTFTILEPKNEGTILTKEHI